ncbi:hypothetical protein D3C72_1826680 [compost metagenome]
MLVAQIGGDRFGRRIDVAMRHHHTLRASCGAGGINQHCKIDIDAAVGDRLGILLKACVECGGARRHLAVRRSR